MAPWMILAAIGGTLAIAAVTWLVAAALLRAVDLLDLVDDEGEW